MPNYLDSDIELVREAVANSQSFLLTCHVHPDGDALGSSMAMFHALKSIGKNVVATFPNPFVIPESLKSTLPGIENVLSMQEVVDLKLKFDVAMTFDCGSRTRLGGLEKLLNEAKTFINVDHHLSNEKFGDINIIDIEAASSGSVVLTILDACEIELDKDSAQCLYVALLTDTGRFQFSSTNSKVFDQASRLAKFDLPIAEMSRILTEEDPFAFLKLAGQALSLMEFDFDSKLVSAVSTVEMRDAHGVKYDETEGLIEIVRRTRESDVACVVKEFEKGDYRVSLRSLGEIDVCIIAESKGGGGHRFAAGFTSTDAPQEIISSVRSEINSQRGSRK